ncbi:filamentation protein-like protein [Lophiotrema nucula]|uniref:Filamentation protein-like protein n=1 Tax=Lophiotrema nucula TaxID=690887 RepID=A0A6A5Z6W9_9PLEO|nr:filamentation protein-like protein [Lophiotrema nucula]
MLRQTSHESDKAVRYITQLDEARCSGRWKDVPELCRKVEKHAPHRLTLTARSEAKIAAYTTQRPSTAASTASTGLSKIIPELLTAIDEEGDHAQDAFQAHVCLGWLHYVLEEPGLAVARFPKDFREVASRLERESLSGWSRVCIVKGVFLKGSSQEKTGAVDDAMHAYTSILPWLGTNKSIQAESAQYKMWTERLLVRLCLLSDQSTETGEYVEPSEALQAYRFWAKYWESTAKNTTGESSNSAKYRRLAWKAYYESLSIILRDNLTYAPETHYLESSAEKQRVPNVRLQQRAEIKRVEAIYESLLLKEKHFPKASQYNGEIEAWVDAVMENWRYLCGPNWSDGDLGEGGKEGVGRGVLDILYRAATKTFHSTQILRHLFTVHAALAEFDLAFKAYDSYVEIITRGKDRSSKTGEEEVGIDDDTTILRTSAEAVRVLCRFGSRKESERALEIGDNIERWLEQTIQNRSRNSEAGSAISVETAVAPRSLALAYCAIGTSQAQWARFTYNADERNPIQTKAIKYLRRSLEPQLEDPNNLEALYALGLVLAEMRDITGAIKVVKHALSPATKNKSSLSADGVISGGLSTEFGRERKLIPFWHLLSLLLTTRSDFESAERACENAFEQFGDLAILFGKEDDAYRSEHLNRANGRDAKASGVVDQMESFERTGIISIKMTQLALLEELEGANIAVDGSDELLALYARLFGDPSAEQVTLQPPATAAPPLKSAVGTIRGSIFRGKGSIRSTKKETTARNSSIASSRPSTIAEQGTSNPAIQVTDENGSSHANGQQHHHHLFHHHKHEDERPGVTRSPSKLKKRSASSLHQKSQSQSERAPAVPNIPNGIVNGTSTRDSTIGGESPGQASVSNSIRKSIESNDRPLRSVPHNLPLSSQPHPPGHNRQPPKQDVRLPTHVPDASYVPPDPRFSAIQQRRHRVTVLVSVWVFISGLYLRAKEYDDAKGAVTEALKLVEHFEAEVAQETASSKAFAERGWGGGKSIEELWADAFAAHGELLVAQEMKHEARTDFERALLHYPDHPEAIVGLSNILLDIYSQVIPLEPSNGSEAASSPLPLSESLTPEPPTDPKKVQNSFLHTPSVENQVSPPELNRLAARDRACGLLSILTKLGAGWDYSEAWYALARAYEESGQIEKTKEVLWWCVELEDTHPIRAWKDVALGGFVL